MPTPDVAYINSLPPEKRAAGQRMLDEVDSLLEALLPPIKRYIDLEIAKAVAERLTFAEQTAQLARQALRSQ